MAITSPYRRPIACLLKLTSKFNYQNAQYCISLSTCKINFIHFFDFLALEWTFKILTSSHNQSYLIGLFPNMRVLALQNLPVHACTHWLSSLIEWNRKLAMHWKLEQQELIANANITIEREVKATLTRSNITSKQSLKMKLYNK